MKYAQTHNIYYGSKIEVGWYETQTLNTVVYIGHSEYIFVSPTYKA